MKTNKLKNSLKIGILFFSISLLLINCQNDFDEDEIQKTEYKMKFLSKSEISKNISIISTIEKLNINIKKEKGKKSIYSDLYDFTIETDYVFYSETLEGLNQTYTFPITRTQDNGLIENIVLSINEDGTNKAQYFTYNFTEEELTYNGNTDYIDISEKVTIIDIQDNNLILELVQNKVNNPPSHNPSMFGHWVLHTWWDDDWNVQRGTWIWVVTMPNHPLLPSDWNQDGGAGGNYNQSDDNTQGGAGASNGVTTPVMRPGIIQYNTFKRRYAATLGKFETNLLMTNIFISQQVFEYLFANNFSTQAQDFVMLGLEDIGDNLYNDFSDFVYAKFEDMIYYNSLDECEKDIIDNLKSLENGKISDILKAFTNKDPNINYNWSMLQDITTPSTSSGLGRTNSNLSNGTAISYIIESRMSEATDLLYAQVIIHESIHAYMVSYLRKEGLTSFNNEFPSVIRSYDSLRELKKGNLMNGAHHAAFITEKYLPEIEKALKEYGEQQNYTLTDQFYRDLSWAGLQHTVAYNNNSILSSLDRNRIELIIEAERTSEINGTTIPKGQKACN